MAPRGGKREGAGMKPYFEEAMEKVFVRMPKDLKEKAIEKGKGVNNSEKIRYVITKGIEKIDEDEIREK